MHRIDRFDNPDILSRRNRRSGSRWQKGRAFVLNKQFERRETSTRQASAA